MNVKQIRKQLTIQVRIRGSQEPKSTSLVPEPVVDTPSTYHHYHVELHFPFTPPNPTGPVLQTVVYNSGNSTVVSVDTVVYSGYSGYSGYSDYSGYSGYSGLEYSFNWDKSISQVQSTFHFSTVGVSGRLLFRRQVRCQNSVSSTVQYSGLSHRAS